MPGWSGRDVAHRRQPGGVGSHRRQPHRATRLVPVAHRLARHLARQGRFPFTPSVPDVHGVLAAAELLLAEGLSAAQARHERVAAACRAGVRAMGLRVWAASDDICGASGTSIAVPNGLIDTEVREHIRTRYGVQLSVGDGAGNILRIGHAGHTARAMWMVAALAAAGRGLADLGARVEIGGLAAAMNVLSTTIPARS